MDKLTVGLSPYGIVDKSIWKTITSKILPKFKFEFITLNNMEHLPNVDYLFLDGGHDVTPYYYGELQQKETQPYNERDAYEYYLLHHYFNRRAMISSPFCSSSLRMFLKRNTLSN